MASDAKPARSNWIMKKSGDLSEVLWNVSAPTDFGPCSKEVDNDLKRAEVQEHGYEKMIGNRAPEPGEDAEPRVPH